MEYAGINIDLSYLSDEDMQEVADIIESGNLEPLHKHNAKGAISGVYDNNFVVYIKYQYHFFFYGGMPYLYDQGTYKKDENGLRLQQIIKELIIPEFINVKTIKRIYELLQIDSDLQKKYEELNQHELGTIPFNNGLLDVKAWKLYRYDDLNAEKLNIINQVPHYFSRIQEPPHDIIDKWLDFICSDQDDKEMLLQYSGLCLTNDTRQQRFLMIKGKGGTGKSVLINLINDSVGKENTAYLSLEMLTKKDFLTKNVMGKTLNCCADLETKALEETAIIKKLIGEDEITADIKYSVSPITFKNYAKFLFSTNEIPIIKSERTNGFYRRMLVLEMNTTPQEVNPNLLSELESQIDGFIWLSVKALKRMYEAGNITVSKNSKRITDQHQYFSDTVSGFIHAELIDNPSGTIQTSDLTRAYKAFCEREERQALGRNSFLKALEDKGYHRKTERIFVGLSFKPKDFEPADQQELPFD
jgi:P4 family phage/plasmid primase-like protien